MTSVAYKLQIGGRPADSDLLAAIRRIEVEDHAEMADMVRISLAIAVNSKGSGWTVLDDDIFRRLTPIKVLITLGSKPAEPLIAGYVIETRAQLSNEPGESQLEVVAMDATVLMNLEEKVRPWPDMADSDIASAIFSEHGLKPQVEQTRPSRQEVDTTVMQRGTDIQLLQQLARRSGYECFVEVEPGSGTTVGHFHSPRLDTTAQGVLNVNLGAATNVDSFAARNDLIGPLAAKVTGLDVATRSDQPAQVARVSQPTLGKTSTSPNDRPRQVLLANTGLAETGELQTLAQAVVNRSAWSISATGELNTVAYGRILRAKRPLMVRGAGPAFSGMYYVEKVLHSFTENGHSQHFSLRRNALGVTSRDSFADDGMVG